jgi:adenylate cyclase
MRETVRAPQDSPPGGSGSSLIRQGEPDTNTAMPDRPSASPWLLSRKMPVVSEGAVREQLGYILSSPEFKNRPMIRGFLNHVVEETLAGRAGEIKGYTIATRVFGRKKDFDPVTDPIVRIQAARLRRILESYYAGPGRHDRLKIEIVRGSYVPSFSKNIPEKLQGQNLPPKVPMRPPPERAFFSRADFPSIAVLPLENLTNDPNISHLAKGLAEELMAGLARCHGLQLKVSDCAPCRSEEWGGVVKFLLGGSIRKSKDTVKFTLRLMETAPLTQIWAEQYKYGLEPEKEIELQEDIARKATGKIGGFFGVIARKLAPLRSAALPHFEIYEGFSRFGQYLIDLSPQTHAKAVEALERATIDNPAYALFLSLQAFLCTNEHAFLRPENGELMDKAMALARRAVCAEPEDHMARAILSYVLFVSGNRELFLQETKQALLLNPTLPDAVALLGWSLALQGEWDRGLALLREAMGVEPYRPAWLHLAPYLNYFRQGKFQEAYHEAHKFDPPHLYWAPLVKIAALGQLGKPNEAGNAVETLLAIRPDFPANGRRVATFFLKDSNLAHTFFEGLHKAGLETTP